VKVLLDEMLPAGVAYLLPNHEVTTVQQAGFKGLANGVLLRQAALSGFEVLLTADRNLPAQQNITVSAIAVVLVRGSRISEVAGQAAEIEAAVAGARPGTVIRISPG
jgi:hypothetical protein